MKNSLFTRPTRFPDENMHSNYFMYTIPANGSQNNVIPNINSGKQQLTTVTYHQNATMTNNAAVIRSSAISQNTVHHSTNAHHSNNQDIETPPNNIHMCQICCQKFQKSSSLKKHMRIHQASSRDSDNSPYKCNACKIDYLNAVAFEEHIKTEHGQPQAFKCIDCGCFRAVELTTTQPFRCEGCSRRKSQPFESSGSVNYRITSTQNATNSQLVHVNHIKTPKLDLDSLVQTMRTGGDSNSGGSGRRRKLHECPDCHKCYKHQSTLAMHKKIHTGEYKYKCQYCQKEFYLAEYYNRHMRVHTKEKPYQCDVCDKAFSQSNTLIQHKRIHTGLQQFSFDFEFEF